MDEKERSNRIQSMQEIAEQYKDAQRRVAKESPCPTCGRCPTCGEYKNVYGRIGDRY